MQPDQQYKVKTFFFFAFCANIIWHMLIIYCHFHVSLRGSLVRFEPKAHLCGVRAISLLLSCLKVHIASLMLIVYICSCVCVSSSSQLTWTTPSWRRTGLTSKSTCLHSSVSDVVVSVRSLCTFCQIRNKLMTLNAGWITHCVQHSFSQFISSVKGIIHL